MKPIPLYIAVESVLETQSWTLLNMDGHELAAAGTMLSKAYRVLVADLRRSGDDTPVDMDPVLDKTQKIALDAFTGEPSLIKACEQSRSALADVVQERIRDADLPTIPRSVAVDCIEEAAIWAGLNMEGEELNVAHAVLDAARKRITHPDLGDLLDTPVKVEREMIQATYEVRGEDQKNPPSPQDVAGQRRFGSLNRACRQIETIVMGNYRKYRDRQLSGKKQ